MFLDERLADDVFNLMSNEDKFIELSEKYIQASETIIFMINAIRADANTDWRAKRHLKKLLRTLSRKTGLDEESAEVFLFTAIVFVIAERLSKV
jgi:GDP-D-mannose dehydratase